MPIDRSMISALAVLGFAYLSSRRADKGVSWCEKMMRGVRQHIGLDTDTEIIPVDLPVETVRESLAAAMEARGILNAYCKRCGQCRFGRPAG